MLLVNMLVSQVCSVCELLLLQKSLRDPDALCSLIINCLLNMNKFCGRKQQRIIKEHNMFHTSVYGRMGVQSEVLSFIFSCRSQLSEFLYLKKVFLLAICHT